MHCVKLLGQRLMARDFDRQVAEPQVRIAVLNGYTALGYQSWKLWDKSVRGKGNFSVQPICPTEPRTVPHLSLLAALFEGLNRGLSFLSNASDVRSNRRFVEIDRVKWSTKPADHILVL